MKLSNQSIGTLMMVLQKCLMEQSDIVPMLKDLDFTVDGDEVSVVNPPTIHVDHPSEDEDVAGTSA